MNLRIRTLVFVSVGLLVMAQEPNYTLPPITYTTIEQERQEDRRNGRYLMELVGIPDGDAALVCTNWVCPTSIVVNAVRYDIVTNMWESMIEFDVLTTNLPPEKLVSGNIEVAANGQEARLSAFIRMTGSSMPWEDYAQGVRIQPLDPSTNAMFTCNGSLFTNGGLLVYRNMVMDYGDFYSLTNNPATNVLEFTTAIINAGLLEEDRIVLSPSP